MNWLNPILAALRRPSPEGLVVFLDAEYITKAAMYGKTSLVNTLTAIQSAHVPAVILVETAGTIAARFSTVEAEQFTVDATLADLLPTLPPTVPVYQSAEILVNDYLAAWLPTFCQAGNAALLIGGRRLWQFCGAGAVAGVNELRPGGMTVVTAATIRSDMQVAADRLEEYWAVIGECRFAGVAGIGATRARRWFAQFGSLREIYLHRAELTQAMRVRLEVGVERVRPYLAATPYSIFAANQRRVPPLRFAIPEPPRTAPSAPYLRLIPMSPGSRSEPPEPPAVPAWAAELEPDLEMPF